MKMTAALQFHPRPGCKRRLTGAIFAFSVSMNAGWALAQSAPAQPTPQASPAAPMQGASEPAAANSMSSAASASSDASASDAAEAAASTPRPPTCSVLTQRAMSVDLRAATALAQSKGVDEIAKLFDRAIAQWTLALDGCEGRARERAQKNLDDNERQRGLIAERQAAGSQCEMSHRDAAALQDLAARAFGERRWADAASLYSKTETMWDLAAEHCTGSQQQIASKRREQAEIDAHNAEHCAPLFERAREYTQKFRSAAAGLNPTDRQQQSQTSETLWRKAVANCKGSALDLAGNNAQAVARERGTPWVSTEPVETARAPAPKAPTTPSPGSGKANASAVAPTQAQPSAAPAMPAVPKLTTAATAPVAAAAVAPAANSTASASMLGALSSIVNAAANTATPNAAGGKPSESYKTTAYDMDILTGDTRYKGLFSREDGQVVTGNGRVEWSNGDVYIGDLLRSIRQGKGEFVWANGQRYSGDWVQNKATGKGKIIFPNGNQYEGTVVDGTPEGEGQMSYASGDLYKGQVSAGIPHGRGNYRWTNGQQFEGELVRGVPNGKGVLRFSSGARYEGVILSGQPQGHGVMHFVSGDRYEGNFHQGQSQGQGSYFWKAGERYVGDWLNGAKHGKGIFYWPNGDRWEGDFKDDARTEFGQFIPKE